MERYSEVEKFMARHCSTFWFVGSLVGSEAPSGKFPCSSRDDSLREALFIQTHGQREWNTDSKESVGV